MASTYVSDKFAALTANGTTGGVAQIASNTGWIAGSIVWLNGTGEAALECVIVEQISTNQVRLRKTSSVAKRGYTDISAYTTAQNSTLSLEGQVVAVLTPFTPAEKV